ncbi:twin-arginine translocase subunit TatC [Salinicoccus albus]|uniref:twin-arginine translocase subunit TatC n=1 Tax=Salinicoccus albus TaxID=418756 RepID=UPI00037E1FD9|nr:twin-arginine translocase subunit TatC [Salinicoccus albus]
MSDPYKDMSLSPVDKRKRKAEQEKKEKDGADKYHNASGDGGNHSGNSGNNGGQPPKNNGKSSDDEAFASLTGHIEDLRSMLLKSGAVFTAWFLIIFVTVQWWFPVVSKGSDIVVLGPFEVIRFYIRTSAAMSIGLSLPFICWFLWQFVRPGLVEKETSFIKGSLPFMLFLFIVGLSFGYFIVHPISYQFLIEMGERNFDVLVTADEYMSFLLITTIPFGLIFQLPVLVLFLYHIEVLESDNMVKFRKFAYFGLLVITALIAPPDFFTHIITLFPMIVLYEVSIRLVRRKEKKDAKNKGQN